MSDDERGAARERGVGGPLQHAGAGAAGLRGRLVEHRDRRVGEHEPGQRELLGLRGGERCAAVADARGEALRQRLRPGQRADLRERAREPRVGRVRARQPQVVGERAGEHVHLLRHERDRRRVARAELRERCAADPHLAGGRLRDAGGDPRERRLAGTARADQRDALAGREVRSTPASTSGPPT